MFKKILNSAILMSWARDFIKIASPLFVVPLVVAFYDDVEQVFFFYINILFSFVMIADSGISSVMIRATSYFMAGAKSIPKTKEEFDATEELKNVKPNFQKVIELFHTSRWIYLILSTVLVLLLCTVGVFATQNLISKSENSFELWAAYGALVAYFTVFMLNIRWSSLMKGLDFVATEAIFGTIVLSIRFMLWILLLVLKQPPLALTLALLAEGIATHILMRIFVMKWFRKNKLSVRNDGGFSKEIFLSMWPAAWRQGGIQLGNFLVERGNNILVLQISDVKLMANFTFTTWILKTIFGFSLTPVYSRLPILYKFAAARNFEKLRKSAAGYMFLGMTMIAFAYFLLGAFGNPLLELAKSDRQLIVPLSLFIIMALTEMLDLNSSFHAGVYTSTNHIPFFWPSIISGGIIFFAGLYYSLPYHGLVGIILTRFIVQLSFNNWYAMSLNLRLLQWPFFKFLIDVPKYGFRFLFEKIREFVPGFKS